MKAVFILVLLSAYAVYVKAQTACTSSPCFNGATCDPDLVANTYQCICATGFGGPQCVTNCTSAIMDLDTDPYNCGTCGTRCAFGELCCTGVCRSVTTNNTHCGGCGVTCAAGEVCRASTCVAPTRDDTSDACSVDHAICPDAQVCIENIVIDDLPGVIVKVQAAIDAAVFFVDEVLDDALAPASQIPSELGQYIHDEVVLITDKVSKASGSLTPLKNVLVALQSYPSEGFTYDHAEAIGNWLDEYLYQIEQGDGASLNTTRLNEYIYNARLHYTALSLDYDVIRKGVTNSTLALNTTFYELKLSVQSFFGTLIACPIGCCNSKCVAATHPCVLSNALRAHVNFEAVLIDHCDPNPCKNNATCLTSALSFHCDCSAANVAGVIGRYCNETTPVVVPPGPVHGTTAQYYGLMFLSIFVGMVVLFGLFVFFRAL